MEEPIADPPNPAAMTPHERRHPRPRRASPPPNGPNMPRFAFLSHPRKSHETEAKRT